MDYDNTEPESDLNHEKGKWCFMLHRHCDQSESHNCDECLREYLKTHKLE
jgi:hypothetical protein